MGLVALQHMGSSQTRDQTCVPCIGRRILNHRTTREAPYVTSLIYHQHQVFGFTIYIYIFIFLHTYIYIYIFFFFGNCQNENDRGAWRTTVHVASKNQSQLSN